MSNPDPHASPLAWLGDALRDLDDANLLRRRRRVRGLPGGECEIGGRRLYNFAANDYLGLANDPRVSAAAETAAQEYGAGSGASALVTGRTDWHDRLEQRLAEFEGAEAAVLFPTGYAANVGTIAALVGRDDVVFSDLLNHASLIDGCRLSRADVQVFPHGDVDALETALAQTSGYRRRLIVTDGLFSMDGDLALLPGLCDLAERFDAALLVDEAHATGVLGEHGRGAAEDLGVENRVSVRVGTLSKAIGSLGGFVTGSRPLVDWLWNRARTQMFSTALPPGACAAACASLDLIANEPQRRIELRERSDRFRKTLEDAGISVPPNGVGPVVPIILEQPAAALEAAAALEVRGFVVGAIRPPTVPAGTSRLRISISHAHPPDIVDALAAAIVEILQPLAR